MVSQNFKQDKSGTLFVSEHNCPGSPDFEIAEVLSTGLGLDNSSISSMVFLGAQGRNILPIELEKQEDGDSRFKRLKFTAPSQQCVYFSVPENSSPLGLTLKKTPSFLDLIESELSHSSFSCSESKKRKIADADASAQQINAKTKASNFSASILRIGSWVRTSQHEGELVAKFYYAKRKLVWEVLDGGLKSKIEVPWSDIASLKAACNDNEPQTLEIELLRPPLFFRETNPQPRKHTLWKATSDFTSGQASAFRRHFLQFPQGTLLKHYQKLLQLDNRLFSLTKKPYPFLNSPFFGQDNLGIRNPNDHTLFGLEGQFSDLPKQLLDSGIGNDCLEQVHCFTLSSPTFRRQHVNLENAVAYSETSPARSGAGGGCVGHGTPVSIANSFPSLYVSLPPSLSDFGLPSMNECHHYMENAGDEVETTEILNNNLGLSGLHPGKLNSIVNIGSNFDLKSNCWFSEIQSNQNPVLLKDFDHTSEIDRYFTSGIFYSGQMGCDVQGEISDDYAKLFASISGATPFPASVELNQGTSNENREGVGWAP